MSRNRIKFYSTYDMSAGHYLSKAEEILDNLNLNTPLTDINDAIELYNIKKYFDIDAKLKAWSDLDIKKYNRIAKQLPRLYFSFVNSLKSGELFDVITSVSREYREEIWELIAKCKIYEKIDTESFNKLLKVGDIFIIDILYQKDIVQYFGATIRDYILDYEESAYLILRKYEILREHNNKEIYLPVQLSNDDKEQILIKYINSENSNINYLNVIKNIQSTVELAVSDKTRLLAKKRSEIKQAEIFSNNGGLEFGFKVIFKEGAKKVKEYLAEGLEYTCIYSIDWIKELIESQNKFLLLHIFYHMFDFLDAEMRITLVNNINESSVFMRAMGVKTRKEYPKNESFDMKQWLADMQIQGYSNSLSKFGENLEDIIEYFFKDYLLSEFSIDGFRLSMPTKDATYLEKCITTITAIESIIKQYCIYVRDGSIDFELLQMSSNPIRFKDIPSLLHSKYVYGVSNEYNAISFHLFSDQSSINYVERIGSEYTSFFEMMENEVLSINDYRDYNKPILDYLVDHDIILVNEDDTISYKDKRIIKILHDLYMNQVISYWHYPKKYRSKFDELSERGYIEFSSSLLSLPEIDYFNYFLNKAKFNNGLDLSNLYRHGIQHTHEDELLHEANYIKFVKLFILIILKINDDLCLYYDSQDDD